MLQSQKDHSLDLANNENQNQSAIEASERKKQVSTIQATKFYFAAASVQHDRFYGVQTEHEKRLKIAKLVKDEETTLISRVLLLDDFGCAPKLVDIKAMADMILMEREATPMKRVTKYWVRKFVNRSAELSGRFEKRNQDKHDLAGCIVDWFRRLENIKANYDIHENDIYNLSLRDMEMCANTKRASLAKDAGSRHQQTRKRSDMATVIECTNATGWALPAYICFQIEPSSESEAEQIPTDWQIEISSELWNPHIIGLHWLQKHFHPKTEDCVKGQFRLLVLDGQADKLGFAFYRLCELYKIIPLCIPPKSSNFLLPLDTWPFDELGKSYCKRVEQSVTGKADSGKLHYLEEYVSTRGEVMTECQIKKSFEAVGLVPYNPKRVTLKHLSDSQSRPHTPSPSPSPLPSPSASLIMITKDISVEEPKTPTGVEELRHLKKQFYLCLRENQPEEPKIEHCIFEKVAKSCEMNMRQIAIWEKHVEQQSSQLKKGQRECKDDKGLSNNIENNKKAQAATRILEKKVSGNKNNSSEREILMKTDESGMRFKEDVSVKGSKDSTEEIKLEPDTTVMFSREESAENKSSSSEKDTDTNQNSVSFWTRHSLWI